MKNKPYLQKNTVEDAITKKNNFLQKKPIKVQEWLKENNIFSYFTGYNNRGVPTFTFHLTDWIQSVNQERAVNGAVEQINVFRQVHSTYAGEQNLGQNPVVEINISQHAQQLKQNKGVAPIFHLKIESKKVREDYLKQNKEVINQYPEERIVISAESTSEEVNNSNIPLHYYRSVEKKAPAGVIDSSQDVQQLNKQKKLYNAILDKDDSVNNVCKKKSNLKSKMPDSSKADSQSNVKINNIPVFRMDISKNIKQSNQNVPVVKIDISQDVQQSNKLSVKQSNRQEMIYGKILDNDFDCKKDNPKNQLHQPQMQKFLANYLAQVRS